MKNPLQLFIIVLCNFFYAHNNLCTWFKNVKLRAKENELCMGKINPRFIQLLNHYSSLTLSAIQKFPKSAIIAQTVHLTKLIVINDKGIIIIV